MIGRSTTFTRKRDKAWLFLLTTLCAASSFAAAPQIHVNRLGFFVGDTISLSMPAHSPIAPIVEWNGTQTPFYRTPEDDWRALVAVTTASQPGMTELMVHFSHDVNDPLEGPVRVEIWSTHSATETIAFPPEKKVLLNDPAEEIESAQIREALAKTETEKQLWDGLFMPPIPGAVISEFGVTRNKIGQINQNDYHRGVDLAGDKGDNIHAPNNGVVILAKEFKFHGKTVILSHGHGVGSIYIHLSEIDVHEGDVVKQGDTLGEVGSTGLATAPHLHWGVYVHTVAVNPQRWLEEPF